MEKSFIKYHIKRLHLTNKSWGGYFLPNFDYASLYGINPYVEMVLGVNEKIGLFSENLY